MGLFGFDGPTILQSKITSTINITNSILHPVRCSNLSVVDPEGLPVEQVGEALGPVALDDPLAAVQAREAVHVAAGEGREIKKKFEHRLLWPSSFCEITRDVLKPRLFQEDSECSCCLKFDFRRKIDFKGVLQSTKTFLVRIDPPLFRAS